MFSGALLSESQIRGANPNSLIYRKKAIAPTFHGREDEMEHR